MTKTIELHALHKTPLKFIKNHPACEAKVRIGDRVITADFVVDTGADISLIPFNLTRGLPLDTYTVAENYDCGGLGGSLLGRIIEANLLSVANFFAQKPYIFVPHDKNWNIPILGFDILRGIYPFIDTKERAVWFTRIKNAGITRIPSINLDLQCDVLVNDP